MAFEVLDEHEQGELVQKWLRENGLAILVGIGIGFLLIFGWNQWRSHHAQHSVEAAIQFQVLTEKFDKKEWDAVNTVAQKLRSDYADTPYALFAAMRQTNAALTRGEKEAAHEAMEWAYQHASEPALKALTGMRLAQLDMGLGNFEVALKTLDQLPQDGNAAQIQELRGDALMALGRRDEAKGAYTETLTNLDANSPNRAQVEMKLNDLGGEKQGS